MSRSWIDNINFYNNITPLDRTNMMRLVNNTEYLHDVISNLTVTPTEEGIDSPIPKASGDGVIRYVVTVTQDMIWTNNSRPSSPIEGGRYFVAILENPSTYKYHLEIWEYKDGAWWTEENHDQSSTYTEHCWDRCTHDKLYVCQNTNKCYYMNNSLGTATLNHALRPGTTDDSQSFMTETAEAAKTIYNGGGSYAIDGWAGYARSNLLRYRIVIANLTVPEAYGETFGSGPLLTVAFNPWFVINQVVFAPMNKPYGAWDGDALTGLAQGCLRIKDDQSTGKFYFDAFIGTTKLRPYIHTLIGVADVTVL